MTKKIVIPRQCCSEKEKSKQANKNSALSQRISEFIYFAR